MAPAARKSARVAVESIMASNAALLAAAGPEGTQQHYWPAGGVANVSQLGRAQRRWNVPWECYSVVLLWVLGQDVLSWVGG